MTKQEKRGTPLPKGFELRVNESSWVGEGSLSSITIQTEKYHHAHLTKEHKYPGAEYGYKLVYTFQKGKEYRFIRWEGFKNAQEVVKKHPEFRFYERKMSLGIEYCYVPSAFWKSAKDYAERHNWENEVSV